MRWATLLPGLLLVGGCAGAGNPDDRAGSDTEAPRPEAPLVSMSSWVEAEVGVDVDPLADHRPPDADCPVGSLLIEGASFEVRTGLCSYAWVQQPALADLRPGDTVELVFWHSALIAEGPADAHLAVLVDGELLYERVIAIPADPAAYTELVDVPFAAPVGAMVTLHLHNHGANDWNLLRIERVEQ